MCNYITKLQSTTKDITQYCKTKTSSVMHELRAYVYACVMCYEL